ncbi:polysaccharide biosynthesis/export family protein [uncultured Thiocystis sp.]|jgi:polysaccharide export outer membrane protein|uniref:polysaccharide biosynthesis/export family protein n=1 Tax=uncultured Thiocystis sp. TaxID=1202134 RepID=UPI0025F2EFC6|nr:polysaccharide biosynthesis/export family protein [uncultured Thiocystis sp.]
MQLLKFIDLHTSALRQKPGIAGVSVLTTLKKTGIMVVAWIMLPGMIMVNLHAAELGAVDAGYKLRAGDIVNVSVWQEPGLEQLVLVRPDGGISFPLAGDLKAEGLTVDELGRSLKSKLTRYIPDPVVTVTLQEIPGNRVYVVGRVNKPGDFPIISRDLTVMQAISIAGGLSPFAKENKIRILRQVDGKEQSFPFDYKQAIRGEGLSQNIRLQPGDVVVVP